MWNYHKVQWDESNMLMSFISICYFTIFVIYFPSEYLGNWF